VDREQAEHPFGDSLTHGGQVEALVDEPGDAAQLPQLALEVGDRPAQPRDFVVVASVRRGQRSAPAKNARTS
jgi:hypothetical protein